MKKEDLIFPCVEMDIPLFLTPFALLFGVWLLAQVVAHGGRH